MKTSLTIIIGFLVPLALLGCQQQPALPPPVEEEVEQLEEAADFSTSDDPVWGDEDAPLTMVVFSDFQCPYCADFFEGVDQLEQDWISSGKLKIQFRDFPLAKHLNSLSAHVAAAAADKQGKYMEIHRQLYTEQADWAATDRPDEYFLQLAEQLELDLDQFKQDYNNPEFIEEIKQDRDAGRKAGVTGTPGFVLNGKLFQGAMKYDSLVKTLNETFNTL